MAIVVDAFDRVDGNRASRRLGIYSAGYQVLRPDGSPVPGFDTPLVTMRFDRLPSEPGAGPIAYAEGSGITVYGNRTTRFRYVVTNVVRAGEARQGWWDTSPLAPGDYRLRVMVADASGNTAEQEVPVRVVGRSGDPALR